MITEADILFEDNHLIFVNKPAGVLTQPDDTGDPALPELVKAYLKEKYDKPGNVFCGVVHRLDRPVSGVVVLAKTSKALKRMTEAFSKRTVQKVYWALVLHRPKREADTLIHWLIKDPNRNVVTPHLREKPGSLRAELSYEVLGQVGPYWLLEVRPITGRPHQIRVQLAAALGAPIVGDLRYGALQPLPDARLALHARQLTVPHPITAEPLTVTAPLPDAVPWGFAEAFL